MKPWFERWPERLEAELAALQRVGIEFEQDQQALQHRVVRLNIRAPINGESLRLVVTFPDLYPYFRFELQAPDLETLPHHLQPFSKNLCVIPRPTVNWHTSDTVAAFVSKQVPRALRAGRADDQAEVSDVEVHQAEPFSDYYSYQPSAIVIVDGAWTIGTEHRSGRLEIGLLSPIHPGILRGVVLRVLSDDGEELSTAPERLAAATSEVLPGRWCRLAAPIIQNDPKRFFEEAERFDGIQLRGGKIGETSVQVRCVIFPEESGWWRQGVGWVFAVRVRSPVRGKQRPQPSYYLARSGRAGPDDLAARIPSLLGLRDRKVAVCGLGAVGAPIALEIARAGVGQVRLLDCDYVDPGNLVRWPLGLSAAGFLKTDALESAIQSHYPYTQIKTFPHRLGAVRDPGTPVDSDLEVVESFTVGASLILDTAAELGIQQLLSERARMLGIPYISVTATPGGWGGLIIRIRPGLTEGCWMCAQHRLLPETSFIRTPPQDPQGGVQPPGCADPTFVGTGFDIGIVAVAGARAVVATLTRGIAEAYPDGDWDVTVISLRGEDGAWREPEFREHLLPRFQNCRNCSPGCLWLPRSVLRQLTDESDRLAPKETGGVLLGYHAGKDSVVVHATGPGPDARHQVDGYSPDYEHDAGEIARLYAASGRRLRYLGDWHTHPCGGGHLSPRDVRTLKRIASTPGARVRNPTMLILADVDGWTSQAWRGRKHRRKWWFDRLDVEELEIRIFDDAVELA